METAVSFFKVEVDSKRQPGDWTIDEIVALENQGKRVQILRTASVQLWIGGEYQRTEKPRRFRRWR